MGNSIDCLPQISTLMSAFKKLNFMPHMYTLLEEQGVVCVPSKKPRLAGMRKMKNRECFRNAFLTAQHYGLTYVEGLATCIIPVHHAWCVTAEGEVVDPTWKTAGSEYFGVLIQLDEVCRISLESGYWGVLDNPASNQIYTLPANTYKAAKAW